MVIEILDNIKVTNNSEIGTFKCIGLNKHGHNFSMQWPTCLVRSLGYFQANKSKIRINVDSRR